MKHIFYFLFPAFFACCQAQPTVSGTVMFAGDGTPMPGVEVVVRDTAGAIVTTQTTDENGAYNIEVGPGAWTVEPIKRCDTLTGIDWSDGELLQAHLVAAAPLGQWQKFAADVNRSGAMTSYDGYLINAALLGNMQARQIVGGWWTFCPIDYVAPSIGGFFIPQYPVSVTVVVGSDGGVVDFVGFRRGDVNMSAINQ